MSFTPSPFCAVEAWFFLLPASELKAVFEPFVPVLECSLFSSSLVAYDHILLAVAHTVVANLGLVDSEGVIAVVVERLEEFVVERSVSLQGV